MKPSLLLAALAIAVAPVVLADRNFNNASGDYLWFNAGNWQQGEWPTGDSSEGWSYVNDSGIPAGKKTDSDHPAIIESATETARTTVLGIGWGNDDSGHLAIRSAFEASGASTIARGQRSTGLLSVQGGNAVFTANLTCGQLADSTGIVEVVSGSLSVNTASSNDNWLKLGENGNGILRVKGGSVHLLSNLTIGNNPSASGTAEISGGTLRVDRTVGHWMGHAIWRQSGGDATVAMTMTLGSGFNNGLAAPSTFEMSGGTLDVTQKIFAGSNGGCDWRQNGGTVTVGSGGIVMGNGAASVVDFSLGGTGEISTSGEIYMASGKSNASIGPGAVFTGRQDGGRLAAAIVNMASQSNTVCRYGLESGSFEVSNLLRVGLSGSGEFIQDGGAVSCLGLNVAQQFADNFDTSSASSYTMSGGTLVVTNQTNLGLLGGDGTLSILGGSATFRNWIFVGRTALSGNQAKGTLVIGGEADVSCLGEIAIGQEGTGKGVLHLFGGGSGTHSHESNLYFNNDPVLRATVDAKGLNGFNVAGNLQINSPLVVEPIRTRGAKPGTYTLLKWNRGFVNNGISLAPGTDPSIWSLDVDTDAKVVTLTLHAPGTVLYVK